MEKETLFPQRLRSLRKQKKWRQKDLAEKMNCAPSTITRWENGDAEPSIEDQKKLATLFSVSMDYLAGLTNNSLPRNEDTPDLEELFKKPLLYKGQEIPAEDLDFFINLADRILFDLKKHKR